MMALMLYVTVCYVLFAHTNAAGLLGTNRGSVYLDGKGPRVVW